MKRKYVKHTIEEVQRVFSEEGYILSSTEYTNIRTRLIYVCSNGHEHATTYHNWLKGNRCPYCSKKAKKSLKDVYKILNRHGYSLKSKEYENAFSPLEVICNNGHLVTTNWHRLNTYGVGCKECRCIDILGSGNPNWKGGVSCEPYCDDWTTDLKEYIKERDNYMCLNPYCFKDCNILSVHHINYDKKDCSPNNLITICRTCNSRANKNRKWHENWYNTIVERRGYTTELGAHYAR